MDSCSKKWFSLFLSVLLIASAVCAFMPGTKAAELTLEQKATTLTTEVLGFDISKYEVQIKNYEHNTMWYLDVVPQHTIDYNLTSNKDNFQLRYTFANNNLQKIAIYKTGPMQERSNYFRDVDVAKNFLTKYQKYSGNPLYNQLSTMIPTESIVGNSTITSENAALEITVTENDTIFKWYYTANGAVAPYSKFISIIIERGTLSTFVDNWQLYPVGSTCVGLSRDEALVVALEAARSHVWSLDVEASSLSVENFNEANVCWEALVFMSSVDADNTRGEYPLVLYPVWQFGIALDRWYGYMYGVEVDVWADSGEVRRVHEAWSMILPDDPNIPSPSVEPSPSPSVEPSPNPSSSSPSGSGSSGKSGSTSSAGDLSVPAVGVQLDVSDGQSDRGSEPVAIADHETMDTTHGDGVPIDIPLTLVVVIFGVLVVGVCVYLVLIRKFRFLGNVCL